MSDDNVQARGDRNTSRTVRLVVIAIIVIAIVAVAVDNREDVPVGYVFGEVSAPIWVVLVAAGVAGIVIGWLLQHRSRRDRALPAGPPPPTRDGQDPQLFGLAVRM